MHALRIAYQRHELLTTGAISLPVPEPARSRLMAVRHGEPSLPELTGLLNDAESALRRAVEASRLPEHADSDRVNEFLVAAYERSWASDRGPAN